MRMRLLRVVLSAPLECTLHCVHTCARVHLYQRAVRVECPVCRVKQCLYLDDVLTPMHRAIGPSLSNGRNSALVYPTDTAAEKGTAVVLSWMRKRHTDHFRADRASYC